VPLTRQGEIHPVQQRALGDRAALFRSSRIEDKMGL
jgi:hypothetical protein